jgi:hypothetical protein
MQTFERIANRVLSGAVIALAINNSLVLFRKRYAIHPFTKVGWQTEQLSIIFMLSVAGLTFLYLEFQAQADTTRCRHVVALLALATVCISIFLRYFWISSALIALFSLLYAMALIRFYWRTHKLLQQLALSVCFSTFTLFLGLLLAGYLGKVN